MQFETTVQIEAPEQAVWAAVIDVQGWPQWTDSMRDVRWIDDDGMRIGDRLRVSLTSFVGPGARWAPGTAARGGIGSVLGLPAVGSRLDGTAVAGEVRVG